jgi:hypothetical protein
MRGATEQGGAHTQEFMAVQGDPTPLAEVTGTELLGAALSAPLSVYKTVYCLPMLTVSAAKVWPPRADVASARCVLVLTLTAGRRRARAWSRRCRATRQTTMPRSATLSKSRPCAKSTISRCACDASAGPHHH